MPRHSSFLAEQRPRDHQGQLVHRSGGDGKLECFAQIESYTRGDPETLETLRDIKRVATEMKSSLLNGDLRRFGELLGEEWRYKKRLDTSISNSQIESIYAAALQNGAVGGKVLGAGDGGHMLFFVEFEKRRALTRFFESKSYRPISFSFDGQGVISWKLREDGVLA